MVRKKFPFLKESILGLVALSILTIQLTAPGQPVDPLTIPKYKSPLVIPPAYISEKQNLNYDYYEIGVSQFQQDLGLGVYDSATNSYIGILDSKGLPVKTTVWGYDGKICDPKSGKVVPFKNYPGATFEAIRGRPVYVRYSNNLYDPSTGLPLSHPLAVDPTLMWANPNNMAMPDPPFPTFPPGFPKAQSPVPIVTHLHGGEVPSTSDGGPLAWFTPNNKITGEAFNPDPYFYPNTQSAATLWYHDHVLGMTRLNVLMGLAGFYLLRDKDDPVANKLPKNKYEIPLAIQDRMFTQDGSLFFPSSGPNPDLHPYWDPEFFGNVILVNGKVWPYLNVEAKRYRFRILDGSNARFYSLRLVNEKNNAPGPVFWQIGTDGGYLGAPVCLKDSLFLSPGERADVIVDFTGLAGSNFILTNTGIAPYPSGDPADSQTVGQIMKFNVVKAVGKDNSTPPSDLRLPSIVYLQPKLPVVNVDTGVVPLNLSGTPQRNMILNEIADPVTGSPQMVLLNNTHFEMPVTEKPRVGATEIWRIINTTMDAHPIHLHLVQFQIIDRQDYDAEKYLADWEALNNGVTPGMGGKYLPVEPYLMNSPVPPPPQERGWKDTYKAFPGQVTRFIIRFAPQDVKNSKPGVNQFAFNPAKGPGYVWHCHIIDHEDNDMMRPYTLEGGCGDSTLVIAKSEGGLPNTPGYLNQNIVAGFNVKGSTLLYGVPSESNIVIRLFTPTGKLVSTLKSGFHKRGYYEVALPIGKSLSHSRYILEYKAATGRMLKIL